MRVRETVPSLSVASQNYSAWVREVFSVSTYCAKLRVFLRKGKKALCVLIKKEREYPTSTQKRQPL